MSSMEKLERHKFQNKLMVKRIGITIRFKEGWIYLIIERINTFYLCIYFNQIKVKYNKNISHM